MATKSKKSVKPKVMVGRRKKASTPKSQRSIQLSRDDESTARQVLANHKTWITENPNGTVGELRERLAEALDPCLQIIDAEDDPHILDFDDVPEPLVSELAEWQNDDPDCTFSYRETDLEDLLCDAEQLAVSLGADCKLASLRELLRQ